jgi:hypothetical protein
MDFMKRGLVVAIDRCALELNGSVMGVQMLLMEMEGDEERLG